MLFTTIVNPTEEDGMTRALERPPASGGRTKKKTETAKLVVANGNDMSEAARIGFKLAGSGLSAAGIGLLEGLSRKGKLAWWAGLRPGARGMVMVAFTIVAGVLARRWRHQGKHREACGLEAAAIAAWTLAIVYFLEDGQQGGAMAGLGDLTQRKPGDISLDELSALDDQISDDIQGAVDKLQKLAEEHARTERESRASDDGDMGALAMEGDSLIDLDDDPQF